MSPMSAGVLPMLLDMSKDECLGELRSLELLAYRHLVSVFRAQGDLSKEKRKLLAEVQNILGIPLDRHKAEIRRANNDEMLYTVAEMVCGRNTQVEWAVEARRLVPLLPRAIPQIAYTAYATKMAQEHYKINMSKPQPQQTAQHLPEDDLGQMSSDTDSDTETEGLRHFSDDMMPEQLCRRTQYSTALVHAQQSSEPAPRPVTPPPESAQSPPPPAAEKRKRKRWSSLERLVPQPVPLFLAQSPVTPPHPGAHMEYDDSFAELDMPAVKQARRNSGGGMKISMTGGPGLRQPPSSASSSLPAQKVILVSTSGASGGAAPITAGGATGGVNVYQRPISVLKSGSAPSVAAGGGPPTAPVPPPQLGTGATTSSRPSAGGPPAPSGGARTSTAGGPSPSAARSSVQQAGGSSARPVGTAGGGPLVTSVRPISGSIRPLTSASVASATGAGVGALSGRPTPGPQQPSYIAGQPHVTSIIHSGGGPVTASSPPGGGVMARVRPRLANPMGLPPRAPPPHRVTRPQQPQIVLQQQADGAAGLESGSNYSYSGGQQQQQQQQQHGPTQHATLQVRSSGGVLNRSTSLSGVNRTSDLSSGCVINRVVSVGGSPLVAGCSRLITRPALSHSNAPTQQQLGGGQGAPSSTAACSQQASSQHVPSLQYGNTVYQSGPPPHQGPYTGAPTVVGPQQPPQSQSPPVFPGSTSSSTITVVTRTVAPQHQLALQGGGSGGVSQRVVTLNSNRPGGLNAGVGGGGGGGNTSAQRTQPATPGGRNPINATTSTIGITNSSSSTGTRATFGTGGSNRVGSGGNTAGGGGGLITSSISFNNNQSLAGGAGGQGGTGGSIRGSGLSITTSGGGRGGSSLRATTGSIPPRAGGIGLGVPGRGGGALSSRGGGGALSSRGGVRSSMQTVRVPPGSMRNVSAGSGKSNVIVVHKGAPTPSPRTHATYSTTPRDISTKITIGKSVSGGSSTPRLGSSAGMARSAPSLLRTTLQAPHTSKTAPQQDGQQGRSSAPSRYTPPPPSQLKQVDRTTDQQSRTAHHHQQQLHQLSRQEQSNIVLAASDDSNGASEFGRVETDVQESVSLAPGSTGSSGCRSKSSSRSQSPANYSSSSSPPSALQVGLTTPTTFSSSHSTPVDQQHFTSSSIASYHSSSISSSSTPGTSYTIISPATASNAIVEEVTTISAASAQAMYAAANTAAASVASTGAVFSSVNDHSSSQVVAGTTYVAYPASGSGGSNPPQLELGEDWLTLSSTSGTDGLTNDSTTTSATLPNGQMQVLEAMEVLTRGDKESARSLLLQAGIELLDSPATAAGGESVVAAAAGDALLTEENLADEEGTVLLTAHDHLDDSPGEEGGQSLESGSDEVGCSSPGGGNSRVQVGPSRTSVPSHLHTGLFLAATPNTGSSSPKDECDEGDDIDNDE